MVLLSKGFVFGFSFVLLSNENDDLDSESVSESGSDLDLDSDSEAKRVVWNVKIDFRYSSCSFLYASSRAIFSR